MKKIKKKKEQHAMKGSDPWQGNIAEENEETTGRAASDEVLEMDTPGARDELDFIRETSNSKRHKKKKKKKRSYTDMNGTPDKIETGHSADIECAVVGDGDGVEDLCDSGITSSASKTETDAATSQQSSEHSEKKKKKKKKKKSSQHKDWNQDVSTENLDESEVVEDEVQLCDLDLISSTSKTETDAATCQVSSEHYEKKKKKKTKKSSRHKDWNHDVSTENFDVPEVVESEVQLCDSDLILSTSKTGAATSSQESSEHYEKKKKKKKKSSRHKDWNHDVSAQSLEVPELVEDEVQLCDTGVISSTSKTDAATSQEFLDDYERRKKKKKKKKSSKHENWNQDVSAEGLDVPEVVGDEVQSFDSGITSATFETSAVSSNQEISKHYEKEKKKKKKKKSSKHDNPNQDVGARTSFELFEVVGDELQDLLDLGDNLSTFPENAHDNEELSDSELNQKKKKKKKKKKNSEEDVDDVHVRKQLVLEPTLQSDLGNAHDNEELSELNQKKKEKKKKKKKKRYLGDTDCSALREESVNSEKNVDDVHIHRQLVLESDEEERDKHVAENHVEDEGEFLSKHKKKKKKRKKEDSQDYVNSREEFDSETDRQRQGNICVSEDACATSSPEVSKKKRKRKAESEMSDSLSDLFQMVCSKTVFTDPNNNAQTKKRRLTSDAASESRRQSAGNKDNSRRHSAGNKDKPADNLTGNNTASANNGKRSKHIDGGDYSKFNTICYDDYRNLIDEQARRGDNLYRLGRWTKLEKQTLEQNWKQYIKDYDIKEESFDNILGLNNPSLTIDEKRSQKAFLKETAFHTRLAEGLSRPLFSVYHQTRAIYGHKKTRKMTQQEQGRLRELYAEHEGDWDRMAEIMGRTPQSLKLWWENQQEKAARRKVGRWSQEEEDLLIEAIKEFTDSEEISGDLEPVHWAAISERVPTRNLGDCWKYWHSFLKLRLQGKPTKWRGLGVRYGVQLFECLKEQGVDDQSDLDWAKISQAMGGAPRMKIQSMWANWKKRIPEGKNKSFPEMLEFVERAFLPFWRQSRKYNPNLSLSLLETTTADA